MAELLKENIQGAFVGEKPVIEIRKGEEILYRAATSAVFASSGNFTVPVGIKRLKVTVVGGGGGPGGGVYINGILFGGGGGGAGGKGVSEFTGEDLAALVGQIVAVVVGAAGYGQGGWNAGAPGGETSFAKGTAQQVIGYGGAGGDANQGGGAGGGYVAQTGTNGNGGGRGGVASTGGNAAGHYIEGVGTYGGGQVQGVVVIEWEY